jgi:anti-sigma B factor antagonist
MADQPKDKVTCPLVVFRIEPDQVVGDTLAEALRDEFLTLLNRCRAQNAVVDFRSVTYMSSAGFRPLLSLLREVRKRGGRLVLCNLRPVVEETFAITRLINTGGATPSTFEVQGSLPEAMASLDSPEQPQSGPA